MTIYKRVRSSLTRWSGDSRQNETRQGEASHKRIDRPHRYELRPTVRSLEPRFVLNASAVLNDLGQLVITGDNGDDYVRLDVLADGRIELRDINDAIIEITGNPAEPLQSSLDPSAIFSGKIIVDLGSGDDTFDLKIPSGLNVTVINGDGDDTINLFAGAGPLAAAAHDLAADTIRFNPGGGTTDWSNQHFSLVGDVVIGSSDPLQTTTLLVDSAVWDVTGRLTLLGDVEFVGSGVDGLSGGSLNFSSAVLTAATADTTLTIELGQTVDSVLRIGEADDSAGFRIGNLNVSSAAVVEFDAADFGITGDLLVQDVGNELRVGGNLSADSITLRGESVVFDSSSLATNGGDVEIDGPVRLLGDLQVIASGGDVSFGDTIDGGHALMIMAGSGEVELLGNVGSTDPLTALSIEANRVDLASVTLSGGDLVIEADSIDLIGDSYKTVGGGDIRLAGPVRLLLADTTIDAFGSVRFDEAVNGDSGTETLSVLAGLRIETHGPIGQLDTLSLVAHQEVLVSGPITVANRLNLAADTVRVSGDLTLAPGSTGQIAILGGTMVVFDSSSTVEIRSGELFIDGRGGDVDLGDSTVRSDSVAEMSIVDARMITLGNVDLAAGSIDLRTTSVASGDGDIDQAAGTRIVVDRVKIDAAGNVTFASGGNEFAIIEQSRIGGDLVLIDSIGDLALDRIEVLGENVRVETVSTLYLFERGIVAAAADVDLRAGGSILDGASDPDAVHIVAKSLTMVAQSGDIGSPAAPIGVEVTGQIDADSSGAGGDVFLSSQTETMKIGVIDAGVGNIVLSAEAIEDANTSDAADLIAGSITLSATSGIGVGGALQINGAQTIDAVTAQGGIDLRSSSTSDTRVIRMEAETGSVRIDQTGGGRLLVESIFSGRDGVSVVNQDGGIGLLVSPLGGDTIRAGAAGDVVLVAGGSIDMADGATVTADEGKLTLFASGDVTIGGLRSQSTAADAISVTSLAGAIIDGGDQDVDIDANQGGAILTSQFGIGSGNRLETAVAALVARVEQAGEIGIHELDEIRLSDLKTEDGAIQVVAGGTVTAINVESVNRSAIDADFGDADSRDIRIEALGPSADILVNRIVARSSADVLLVAGDDVLGIGDGDGAEIIADDLRIIAGNGTDDGPTAVSLSTEINDLEIAVTGTFRGDIEIREADSLSLASSDRGDDTEQVRTTNGEIRIFAGDSITIRDTDASNDGPGRDSDVEVIAGGEHGRIVLRAPNLIDIGNDVQLVAAQSTDEAVLIESESVILGERIEINTGGGIGVARYFLPRPEAGAVDWAFYDFDSVSTDTLTQENDNDAKGFLSLRVGREGERGLQVDIDWGAPTSRFQTITDVSGDNSRLVDGGTDTGGPITTDPSLRVSHVYTERDIVDSTLNGRRSATDPLEVRFAVSHHASIVIRSSEITQGTDANGQPLSETLPGRLASSTDNPLTPNLLENGVARFIIPNLTVPVAFFPIREIIPETVKPESLMRIPESVSVSGGGIESIPGSASSLVARDEYFQIRVLSPDPRGEDLADPERLPDDILAGDKLKTLIEDLPDGRYEIQYVFGDGNERSLLRFDVRDGKAKALGEDLQGGVLRLQPLPPLDDPQPANSPDEIAPDESEPDELPPAVDGEAIRQLPPQPPVDQGASVDPKVRSDSTHVEHRSRHVEAVNRYSIAGRFLARQDRV